MSCVLSPTSKNFPQTFRLTPRSDFLSTSCCVKNFAISIFFLLLQQFLCSFRDKHLCCCLLPSHSCCVACAFHAALLWVAYEQPRMWVLICLAAAFSATNNNNHTRKKFAQLLLGLFVRGACSPEIRLALLISMHNCLAACWGAANYIATPSTALSPNPHAVLLC